MKTILIILCTACCALGRDETAVAAAEAACGPRDAMFEVRADVAQHPTPPPESGKALIYVAQRDGISSKFGIDGKWVGANKGKTYFFVSIDPGEHHLCAIGHIGAGPGNWVALHHLRAAAGATYCYVPQISGSESWGLKFDLSQVDTDQGKYLVARAKFSTSRSK